MTFQVLKSQVPDNYSDLVEQYRSAMEAWVTQVGVPPPTAHPMIERAVVRIPRPGEPDQFVAKFEIIDDTPPPPTLAERKAALIMQSRQQEQAEIDALIPPGKLRLLEMDFTRALSVKEESRTPDQQKTIEDWAALNAQMQEVRYAGARREAEIEDLAG